MTFGFDGPLKIWVVRWAVLTSLSMGWYSLTAQSGSAPSAEGDILAVNRDTSIDPATDFFNYANGGWLRRNPIPASESNWGIGKVVQDEIYDRLRLINETDAQSKATVGTSARKIGDFWATAMDTNLATRLELQPLQVELARIEAIATVDDAVEVSFALRPLGVNAFLSAGIGQDQKQSDAMSVQLGQGGIGASGPGFLFQFGIGGCQDSARIFGPSDA